MSKIIHVETKITAVFGVLDNDGNVLNKTPISFEIPKHTEEVFSQALDALNKSKAQLQQQLEAPPKD